MEMTTAHYGSPGRVPGSLKSWCNSFDGLILSSWEEFCRQPVRCLVCAGAMAALANTTPSGQSYAHMRKDGKVIPWCDSQSANTFGSFLDFMLQPTRCRICEAEFLKRENESNSRSTRQLAVSPEGPAVKHDDDKPRYDLLPWEGLEEVAKVMAFGANKYAAHNWRKGLEWHRLARATIGHVVLWLRGEDNDPESGLSHLGHAGANVLMLLTLVLTKTGTDTRWKKGPQ
jgi:hypothetical protein